MGITAPGVFKENAAMSLWLVSLLQHVSLNRGWSETGQSHQGKQDKEAESIDSSDGLAHFMFVN